MEFEKNRNHPLYLHLSDTPGSMLMLVQLTGPEIYSLWNRSMIINFRVNGKLGFFLRTCRKSEYKIKLGEQ